MTRRRASVCAHARPLVLLGALACAHPPTAHAEALAATARRPPTALLSAPASAPGFPTRPASQDAHHAAERTRARAMAIALEGVDGAPTIAVAREVSATALRRGADVEAPWPNFAEPAGRQRPVRGGVVARFGPRWSPSSGTNVRNAGWTWQVEAGDTVAALGRGVVVRIERIMGVGEVVLLDHSGGYHSVYLGLAEVHVRAGDVVDVGAEIGRTGVRSSFDAIELTIEVRRAGVPIDPSPWLRP